VGLLGRPFDHYDYMTFAALFLIMAAVMGLVLFLMGLPGKIALKRNHPHAEAVNIMGWMGFLAVVPWVHAFMWAFHDAATVDIRRFPKDERDAIRKEIERLGGAVKDEYKSAEASEPPEDSQKKI
jgi:hypothetical protein